MSIKDSNDQKHNHLQNQIKMSALEHKNKVLENQLQQVSEATKMNRENNFPQAALTVSHSHILTVSQSQPALERVNSLNFLQKQVRSTSKKAGLQQKREVVESGPLMESIKKLGLGNGKMV